MKTEDEGISPMVAEMVAGLNAFCDAIEAGEPIEKRFTIRTVKLNLKPKAYGPEDVKYVRNTLNASQSLLAQFLGVSVGSVRSWEQGTRPVPPIACRYMDDILAYPDMWRHRLHEAAQETSTS
jgi:putative transcriptional regulator